MKARLLIVLIAAAGFLPATALAQRVPFKKNNNAGNNNAGNNNANNNLGNNNLGNNNFGNNLGFGNNNFGNFGNNLGWNRWNPNYGYGGYGGYGYGRYGRYGRYGSGYGYGSGLGGWSPASVISAMGQYNMSTAQAAGSYQQAYSKYLDNRKKYQATYFDLRRNWASWRPEMRGPPPTEEQIAQFSKARLPAKLSANEFDPAHGVLHWPSVLRNKDYEDDRHHLEGLFAQASADPQASGMGTENYRAIQHSIDDLHNKLRGQIDSYSPDEYIAAEKFLKSLSHQARSPVDSSVAAK